MAIKKRSVTLSADGTLGLGAAYAKVLSVKVAASADTSVSTTIVDRDGKTIATVPSGNYTASAFSKALSEPTANIVDTGNTAITNAASTGVVARSPLTVPFAGSLGSGTATVTVMVEV